jgi:hypothetical protein
MARKANAQTVEPSIWIRDRAFRRCEVFLSCLAQAGVDPLTAHALLAAPLIPENYECKNQS